MANKFRGIEPIEPGVDSARPVQMGMDGGYRGDVSPRQVPPNSSPELSEIRFERTAIRKDFGWTAIGTAAASRILALIEHKYIDTNLTFHRNVRIVRNATFAELWAWDGANWVLVDTSTVTIVDEYISAISAQGCLYLAEGSQILEWCEVLQKTLQENDFPPSSGIGVIGWNTIATITPASLSALDYSINYFIQINGNPGGLFPPDTYVKLEFYHEAALLGIAEFLVTSAEGLVTLSNEVFNFTRIITNLDEVSIKLAEVTGGLSASFAPVWVVTGGPDPDSVATKTPNNQPADGDAYSGTLVCTVNASVTLTVDVEVEYSGAPGVWIHLTFVDFVNPDPFPAPVGGFINVIAPQPLNQTITRFGITNITPANGTIDTGWWIEWTARQLNMAVHGHNKAVNLEDPAGVTYETTGAIVSQFEAIDPGPAARYLVHFARRLVAFWNFGDSQVVSWTQDGILNAFTGAGSGEVFLVETHSDAIDAIQGGAVLSSNFLAVFRSRSIWRAFETGNEALAIGIVSWIENLGTNYPFSIRNVRGGVIFLGHDQMVYFLTEEGATAIGKPIHQDIVEALTGDLTLVDSGYDPTFGEYYLGIPEAAATTITLAWIFDVDRFLDKQEIVWRKRPMLIERFAAFGVSEVE